jgi:hypothetical protein
MPAIRDASFAYESVTRDTAGNIVKAVQIEKDA